MRWKAAGRLLEAGCVRASEQRVGLLVGGEWQGSFTVRGSGESARDDKMSQSSLLNSTALLQHNHLGTVLPQYKQ